MDEIKYGPNKNHKIILTNNININNKMWTEKKSIENKDNEKFGTSSVYIIHKWYDSDSSKWVNEVMILNVTVFS